MSLARLKTVSIKELVANAADIVAPVMADQNLHRSQPLARAEHLPFEQLYSKPTTTRGE